MSTIAKMTKHKDGSFSGTLILPSLAGAEIIFRTVEKQTETGPAYRVYVGEFESGAAWKRTSKKGNSYLSVRLIDPGFDGKVIYPVLLNSDRDHAYSLDWSPTRKIKTPAETVKETEF
jgi:uncharacterized protein (DUF736 family)